MAKIAQRFKVPEADELLNRIFWKRLSLDGSGSASSRRILTIDWKTLKLASDEDIVGFWAEPLMTLQEPRFQKYFSTE